MDKEDFIAELPAVTCLVAINVRKVRTIVGSRIWIWIFKETPFPQTEENTNGRLSWRELR